MTGYGGKKSACAFDCFLRKPLLLLASLSVKGHDDPANNTVGILHT